MAILGVIFLQYSHTGSMFPNHSQENSLCFSPRFPEFEGNTTFDRLIIWFNQSEGVLLSNGSKFRKIRWKRIECSREWLVYIDHGFCLSFNPFPNEPWFLHVCSTSLLKTMWEKEKLLVTSNSSFSRSVSEFSLIWIKEGKTINLGVI